VLRDFPPEQVFAQTLLGFETAEASIDAKDDTWVGINFVRPEDDYVAMRDYTMQMKMIGFLHSLYPNVHISLHAGELAPGLVPPEGLRFHIRQAWSWPTRSGSATAWT
jgi:adenosine deaminase